MCLHAQLLGRVQLFAVPWTVGCQAPLSMEFSRQKYCSGLAFPTLGDLPDPGIRRTFPLCLLHWQVDLYHCNTWETPQYNVESNNIEICTKHTGVLTNKAINLRGESRKSREEKTMESFKEWPNGQGAAAFQAEETNSTVTQSEGHKYWKKSKWSGEAWPQSSRRSVWVHNKERSWSHKEKAFLWTSKKFRLLDMGSVMILFWFCLVLTPLAILKHVMSCSLVHFITIPTIYL